MPLQPAPDKLQVTPVLALPVTVAVNCWVAPVITVAVFGDIVIAVAVAAATSSVALLLIAVPSLLLTTTLNCSRLSEAVMGGVVYDEEFAPPIAIPFFCHV
jgi:hypothetical protein